ncbi:MAG: DUF1565 domain-containing protein [Polyangiaceae bacterium]
MRDTLWILVAALGLVGCGSDDDGGGASSGGAAGNGASSGGGAAGSGASGGASGAGASSSGGSGGTGGLAGSGGSGTGGTPGACGDIVTFETGKTPTQQIHVSTSGNDSNNGTAGSPVKTLEKAVTLANPGTAIVVHAGTYPGGEYLEGVTGSAAAPIWIGGAPGEGKPVFSGGGQAFQLSKARYVIVHDLEVDGPSDNGINCDDGSEYANPDAARYLVFRNLDIHDVGGTGNQDCLKLSGIDDFWVLDNQFARCGGGSSGSGIDQVGCHQGVIARNAFQQMSGNAVQAKGGSEDIEIRWNRIEDGGERGVNMGGSTGDQFFRPPLSSSAPNFEAKNIRVLANVFVGAVTPVGFVGCVDCVAANNTIVDPTNWLLRILQEKTTSGGYTFQETQNGRFSNNLVYFDRADLSTYVNVGPNTQAGTFTFENNLWFAHDNPAQSAPTNLPAAESGAVTGQDPALANPGAGNYGIPPTSPAAGAGTPIPGLSGDITGKCYATPPSIGAYEAL